METYWLNQTEGESMRFTGSLLGQSSHTVRDIRGGYMTRLYQMKKLSLYKTFKSGKYILHTEHYELKPTDNESVVINVCRDSTHVFEILGGNRFVLPMRNMELLRQAAVSDPAFAKFLKTVVTDVD